MKQITFIIKLCSYLISQDFYKEKIKKKCFIWYKMTDRDNIFFFFMILIACFGSFILDDIWMKNIQMIYYVDMVIGRFNTMENQLCFKTRITRSIPVSCNTQFHCWTSLQVKNIIGFLHFIHRWTENLLCEYGIPSCFSAESRTAIDEQLLNFLN